MTTKRNDSQDGVTLVELMVALLISFLLLSTILLTLNYELQSYQLVSAQDIVQSEMAYYDAKLQLELQNLTNVSIDTAYPSGTAITGINVFGDRVVIAVQQRPGLAIWNLTFVTTGKTNQTTVQTLKSDEVTFAGTTFSVSGKLITVAWQATMVGAINATSYHTSTNFAVGGGY